MTPSSASGTSTPSSSTRDVTTATYLPSLNPSSTSLRSAFAVLCVIIGMRNLSDIERAILLFCVNIMVFLLAPGASPEASRPPTVARPQFSASIRSSSAVFAAALNAISFALFLASSALRAPLLRFDMRMSRFRLYMDSVLMPSPRSPLRNSDLHLAYSACSASVSRTRILCTSCLARCLLAASSPEPLVYTTPPASLGISECSPSSRSSVAVSPSRNGAMHCSATSR